MSVGDDRRTERGAGEGSPAPDASPDPPVDAAPGSAEATEPEAEAAEAVQHDVEELVAKARERDEYLSLAQRTQADFENYRKRAAKDLGAAESRGIAKLARELLPALDNLALALVAAESNGGEAQLADGIRLVQRDLLGALSRHGIEPYSPEGERFDPSEHEAMAQLAVEGAEPGTVVEVYQQGYRANGTVLRPARVVVAQ